MRASASLFVTGITLTILKDREFLGLEWARFHGKILDIKCKCNLYFKSVYKLQETRATKALGRLDRRLTVPSEALESSKEIHFLLMRPHRESNPGCLRRRQAC